MKEKVKGGVRVKTLSRIFSNPKSQAQTLSKAMFNSKRLASLGTSHSYETSLTLAAVWLKGTGRGSLLELSPKAAKAFLMERAKTVGQKTLDRDRQALQAVLRHIGRFNEVGRLPVIQAERQQVLNSRNYSAEQVREIIACQTERNGFSTELAFEAGLRAHELLTILPASDRPMSDRPADSEKFRDGVRYTVVGKGGLCREVSIPQHLAERLELRRLVEPIDRVDRRVHYRIHYDLGGGQSWSQSFSEASNRALGFSNGAHGLRHSYAQSRLLEVQVKTGDAERSKRIISQELGHFRAEITDTYLR